MTRDAGVSPPESPRFDSLRRSEDFRRVLDCGYRRRVGGVLLVAAPGDPGRIRVGLVAGRKVGNAVMRNRAKRRLRHALRDVALRPGMDYVAVASAAVVDVPFATLHSWLEQAVRVEK